MSKRYSQNLEDEFDQKYFKHYSEQELFDLAEVEGLIGPSEDSEDFAHFFN